MFKLKAFNQNKYISSKLTLVLNCIYAWVPYELFWMHVCLCTQACNIHSASSKLPWQHRDSCNCHASEAR